MFKLVLCNISHIMSGWNTANEHQVWLTSLCAASDNHFHDHAGVLSPSIPALYTWNTNSSQRAQPELVEECYEYCGLWPNKS
jgi:hypothetical protein